jgi:hypothetical protein
MQFLPRKRRANWRGVRFAVIALMGFWGISTAANQPDIVVAVPGSNVTLWRGWNVSSTIYINISSAGPENCVKAWWIILGVNKDIGTLCGKTQVQITLPLLYGELRAGSIPRKLVIAVSDSASVAYSAELCGKVTQC